MMPQISPEDEPSGFRKLRSSPQPLIRVIRESAIFVIGPVLDLEMGLEFVNGPLLPLLGLGQQGTAQQRTERRGLAVKRCDRAIAAHVLEDGGSMLNHRFILSLKDVPARWGIWAGRFSISLAGETERADGFRTVDPVA